MKTVKAYWRLWVGLTVLVIAALPLMGSFRKNAERWIGFVYQAAYSELTFTTDAVELGDVRIKSTNQSTSDNDYLRASFYAEDSGGGEQELVTVDAVFTDQTAATEDSVLKVGVVTAGTLAAELGLVGTALYPVTDEGLDLGTASLEFKDLYIDGTANVDALNANGYLLVLGSHEYLDSATTTDTVTVANTDADDLVFVTIAESGSSASYVKSAVPGTGNFVVTLDADPGTTLTLNYQVWQN